MERILSGKGPECWVFYVVAAFWNFGKNTKLQPIRPFLLGLSLCSEIDSVILGGEENWWLERVFFPAGNSEPNWKYRCLCHFKCLKFKLEFLVECGWSLGEAQNEKPRVNQFSPTVSNVLSFVPSFFCLFVFVYLFCKGFDASSMTCTPLSPLKSMRFHA